MEWEERVGRDELDKENIFEDDDEAPDGDLVDGKVGGARQDGRRGGRRKGGASRRMGRCLVRKQQTVVEHERILYSFIFLAFCTLRLLQLRFLVERNQTIWVEFGLNVRRFSEDFAQI